MKSAHNILISLVSKNPDKHFPWESERRIQIESTWIWNKISSKIIEVSQICESIYFITTKKEQSIYTTEL